MSNSKAEFKYNSLFERYNISDSCPCGDLREDKLIAYRWSLVPIENDLNFLPNVLYNERKPNKKPRRVNDKVDLKRICGECGISLFTSKEKAVDFFKSLGEPAMGLIGYTHVAEGEVTKLDGLRTPIKSNGHFNFYEYRNSDFKKVFSIIDSLV